MPLNYQLLTSHCFTCVGIWIHEVSSLYLHCKFNKGLFLFWLNSQLFLNKCPPCNGVNFPPVYLCSRSFERPHRPQKTEAQLFEHLNNSVTYFKITFRETSLHQNHRCKQLVKSPHPHKWFLQLRFLLLPDAYDTQASQCRVGNSQQKPFSAMETRRQDNLTVRGKTVSC